MTRRRAQLGATNRKGPRTGAVEIDERLVARVARKLVTKFRPGDSCQRGDVQPHYGKVRGVQVRTPAGEVRTVDVELRPTAREVMRGVAGSYSPSRHLVQITPDPRVCGEARGWVDTIGSVLRHELAHVSDPVIELYRRKHETHCDYVNDPLEITARLAEVRAELERNRSWLARDRRGGERFTKEDVRIYSGTFSSIDDCLTPANRRRFLKLAARVRDQ